MESAPDRASPSVDAREIGRFDRLAADWWNPRGSMRALHRINPLRLAYVRDAVAARFGRSATALDGLEGLALLDIGCGAGLLSEPLARLGAAVTGIDAAPAVIGAATAHAAEAGTGVDYRCTTAEALAAAGQAYEVVLAMEIIEHVPNAGAFLATAARLVAPGGLLVLSTLNRTLKAYGLAVLGAEYVLGWLPRGTHDWSRFLTPAEVEGMGRRAGLVPLGQAGMVYRPLSDEWRLSATDLDVNYLAAFGRD